MSGILARVRSSSKIRSPSRASTPPVDTSERLSTTSTNEELRGDVDLSDDQTTTHELNPDMKKMEFEAPKPFINGESSLPGFISTLTPRTLQYFNEMSNGIDRPAAANINLTESVQLKQLEISDQSNDPAPKPSFWNRILPRTSSRQSITSQETKKPSLLTQLRHSFTSLRKSESRNSFNETESNPPKLETPKSSTSSTAISYTTKCNENQETINPIPLPNEPTTSKQRSPSTVIPRVLRTLNLRRNSDRSHRDRFKEKIQEAALKVEIDLDRRILKEEKEQLERDRKDLDHRRILLEVREREVISKELELEAKKREIEEQSATLKRTEWNLTRLQISLESQKRLMTEGYNSGTNPRDPFGNNQTHIHFHVDKSGDVRLAAQSLVV